MNVWSNQEQSYGLNYEEAVLEQPLQIKEIFMETGVTLPPPRTHNTEQ